MPERKPTAGAEARYWRAHDAHYQERAYLEALHLYLEVLAAHPSSAEAAYSRSQIANIVRLVVPEEERQAALVDLVQARLLREERPRGEG